MKAGLALFLFLALLPAHAHAGDDPSPMIEIGGDAIVQSTPFQDADGNPVEIIPVEIVTEPDGTVAAYAIDSRDNSAERSKQRSPLVTFSWLTPTWSIEAGRPQPVSISYGVIIGPSGAYHDEGLTQGISTGWLLQAQAGLGGIQLSSGIAAGYHRGGKLLSHGLIGADLKMSFLQTWKHAWGVQSGQSYLGLEGDLDVLLKLSFGVLKRVAGDHSAKDWLFTWGIGFGL